jgi:hypothetical protein
MRMPVRVSPRRLKVAIAAAAGLAIAVLVFLAARRLERFDDPATTVPATTVPAVTAPTATTAVVTQPTRADPSAAVRGGTVPNQGRYPWIASIVGSDGGYCTGFLIDPTHVMTAAHCVLGKIGVAGNRVSIGGMRSDEFAEVRKVTRVWKVGASKTRLPINQRFKDWAILELDSPSTKDPVRVNGFQVTVSDADIANNMLWTVGFGKQPGVQPPYPLMHASVYVKFDSGALVSKNTLAPHGTCPGDSGGPLILARADGDVVVGLTSGDEAGKRCGDAQFSIWTPTRPVMEMFFRQQDVVARVKACSYVNRGADKKCPASHPWYSGTWDQGLGTPAGYAGKHCAKNMRCAVEMYDLYMRGHSKVSTPHKR